MKFFILLTFLVSNILAFGAKPSIPRESVAVLYNSDMPESLQLAEYYAKMREIPAENLIGLPLSKEGKITRDNYKKSLEVPLRKHFIEKGWWELGVTNDGIKLSVRNKIQLIVCMYGVPYGIENEANLKLPEGENPTPFTKLNCAAVDSELAVLSVHDVPIYQPLENKYFKADTIFSKANYPFYMLVGRIDAGSFAICKRMIDDAIQIEKTGLWGMAYLDLAQKGDGYKIGDDWIKQIEAKNWKLGIPTTLDKNKDTYLTNYPMRDVAMYFGWYTSGVNGPFLNPDFKFKKGAIAVHLHSFSASDIRNPEASWVGPLVAKGAAATLGNVYEPYLEGSHHFNILHDRLTQGYTLIESAYMSIPLLSWQNLVIGDPLYQPYLHLDGAGVEVEEDKFYRACNKIFQVWGDNVTEVERKMRSAAHTESDGRYFEVLGLFRNFKNEIEEAVRFFSSAEKMYLLESDKTRIQLHIIDLFLESGQKENAIIACKELLTKIKDTPWSLAVLAKLSIVSPPPPPPALPNKQVPQTRK
jgi:uncharacterized protein (TIGR03790 family)